MEQIKGKYYVETNTEGFKWMLDRYMKGEGWRWETHHQELLHTSCLASCSKPHYVLVYSLSFLILPCSLSGYDMSRGRMRWQERSKVRRGRWGQEITRCERHKEGDKKEGRCTNPSIHLGQVHTILMCCVSFLGNIQDSIFLTFNSHHYNRRCTLQYENVIKHHFNSIQTIYSVG